MTQDYVPIIIGVLLGVSEALSLVDKVKPNGILQVLVRVVKALIVETPKIANGVVPETISRGVQVSDQTVVNISGDSI